MKIILIIICIFFSNLLISQNSDTLINKYNDKGEKVGKWITYKWFEGDTLKTICNYYNGVIDGEYYTYYPNGEVLCVIFFKNGVKHGRAKYYYKDGVISDIFLDENGETLYHIKFTPSGEIFQESYGGELIQYYEGKPQNK